MNSDKNSDTEPDADDDWREIVELMALIDEIDHRLNAIGGDQRMSVGPVLGQIQDLRTKIIDHGKGYGLLNESVGEMDLRADAANIDVTLTEKTNGD